MNGYSMSGDQMRGDEMRDDWVTFRQRGNV
jgi:hypothetical protein